MSKHTPEPWNFEGQVKLVGTLDSGQCNEWVGSIFQGTESRYRGEICQFQSATNIDGIKPNEALANASRIVDCVNSLAGISNPSDFVRAARELAEAAGVVLGASDRYFGEQYTCGCVWCERGCKNPHTVLTDALSAFRAAGGGELEEQKHPPAAK